MRVRFGCLGLLLLACLALTACGGGGGNSGEPPPRVVLSLDFVPNAVHAPIYAPARKGRDRAEGIRLEIRQPAAGPDALKLVASGRVDLGVLDIHDLAIAREQGADLVGIAALVARPLAALIARPGIERPRDLEGGIVGVSGLPSDPAFLRAISSTTGPPTGESVRSRSASAR
jgi:NitT/TauT family transport system substrate-binding protein/putative hydroxymethylpyrimidine transport system substrate-binding protein